MARSLGIPRPNCDSQTSEIVDYLFSPDSQEERIAFGVGLPHPRGALDAIIRLLSLGRTLERADTVMPK